MIKRLIRKLRTWDPKYLPNPIYSPSLEYLRKSEELVGKLLSGFKSGVERVSRGERFTGFTDEAWEFLERTYPYYLLLDEEE